MVDGCLRRRSPSLLPVIALLVVAATLGASGCRKRRADAELPAVPDSPPGRVAHYTYEVRQTRPHDPTAFTQGLVFHEGSFLESTGLHGKSTLRQVNPITGAVLKNVPLPHPCFGEGLTVLGDKAYQLTWQNQKGFIYDAATFRFIGEFQYQGEGWGLTTDGTHLILSNGSARLSYHDPITFSIVRTVEVTHAGKPVQHLNELEYIRGEIFANVWQTDTVVRIDPQTGAVRGIIDLSGLLTPAERSAADVLNGIAYDATGDRLFVTGKHWPKLFEVRLKLKP